MSDNNNTNPDNNHTYNNNNEINQAILTHFGNLLTTPQDPNDLQNKEVKMMIKIMVIMKMKKVLLRKKIKKQMLKMKMKEMNKIRVMIQMNHLQCRTPNDVERLKRIVTWKLMMKGRKMIYEENRKLMCQARMMVMMLRSQSQGQNQVVRVEDNE